MAMYLDNFFLSLIILLASILLAHSFKDPKNASTLGLLLLFAPVFPLIDYDRIFVEKQVYLITHSIN